MDMKYIFAFLAAFIITAVVKLIFSEKIKKKKPSLKPFFSKLIYTDQKVKRKKEDVIYSKILYCEEYELKGKPDFIFKNIFTGMLIPVELKSGSIGNEPYPRKGDLMQLAAYFIIIEEYFNIKPKSGRLIYSDYMFVVKNTNKLRQETLNIVCQMRNMLLTGEGDAASNFAKCRYCFMRNTVCEFSPFNKI